MRVGRRRSKLRRRPPPATEFPEPPLSRIALFSRVLHSLLLFALVGSTFAQAFAATAETTDGSKDDATEEMIVSGSRAPRPRATIPNASTVLTGEELDRSVSTSVTDALRFVPGLQVTRQAGPGGRSELFLRGLDSNHVVVLIDGVRLNDPTNSRGGSFDPTTLALLDIERIEIVRGPLSTVYGSDALAGAINVITRRASPDAEPTARLHARGGRFHAGHATARASTGLAGIAGLSLGVSRDTFRDPESAGGYDGTSLKAKLYVPLPFEIDFEAFTRIHESSARGFPDSSGGSELSTLRTMEDRNVREILFGATFEKSFGDLVTFDARVSRASRREELDSPGVDVVPPLDPIGEFDIPPTRSGDEYARWDLGFVSTWTFPSVEVAGTTHATRLILGTDVVYEDGESGTFLDFSGTGAAFAPFPFFDHRRTIGVYGELEQSIGDHITLSGSLRYDTIRGENDRLSPAAGISLRVPDTKLVLFGNFGEGFKLPSFYALGNPLVGSPSLRKETSRGYEIGLRGRTAEGGLGFQLSYFDLRVKNLITFNNATFALENQQRLVSRGIELELDWSPDEWIELRGGGTWNHTDFESNPFDPEQRPRWRGFIELTAHPCDVLDLRLRVLAVSSSKATSFRTAPRVDTLNGYERLDIGVTWRVRDWVDIVLEVQNLTDTTPREAVGFESPGIAPRAGVTFHL